MDPSTSPIRQPRSSAARPFVAPRIGAAFGGPLGRWRRRLMAVGPMLMVLALAGCGGGGGTDVGPAPAPVPAPTGMVDIAIRDADGDFLSYVVDVTSITLERANGDIVETLPLTARVDFASLIELSEFLTAATVPAGVYKRIAIDLDFSNAEIVVQDQRGEALPAIAVDGDGNPLGRFEVRVELTDADAIHVVAGVAAHVTLDFDLAASNEIDFGATPAEVVVAPVMTAIPEWERDREHRVRGLLAQVDVPAASVTLKVRPLRLRQGDFGRFRFLTDDATAFEIDGVEFEGATGLRSLAAAPLDIPVIAQGPTQNGVMTAALVLAGTSVPWADADVVHGVVTARDGDSLTVKAVRVDSADGSDRFRAAMTVLVGEQTVVGAPRLTDAALDQLAISVGSRITAFGELVDDMTFDATAGRVRLASSGLTGAVLSTAPFVVDVLRMNGLRPAAFDFAGTGHTPAEDADPAHYEIDIATLDLAAIDPGDLARVRGLVHRFGDAPPDFHARTVVDVDLEPNAATLLVSWLHAGGTGQPFRAIAPTHLDVDLAGARHLLYVRGIPQSFFANMDAIALEPGALRGVYAVAVRGDAIHVYRDFAAMVDELTRHLDAGSRMTRIAAHGRYNAPTEVLTTPRASFEFIAP